MMKQVALPLCLASLCLLLAACGRKESKPATPATPATPVILSTPGPSLEVSDNFIAIADEGTTRYVVSHPDQLTDALQGKTDDNTMVFPNASADGRTLVFQAKDTASFLRLVREHNRLLGTTFDPATGSSRPGATAATAGTPPSGSGVVSTPTTPPTAVTPPAPVPSPVATPSSVASTTPPAVTPNAPTPPVVKPNPVPTPVTPAVTQTTPAAPTPPAAAKPATGSGTFFFTLEKNGNQFVVGDRNSIGSVFGQGSLATYKTFPKAGAKGQTLVFEDNADGSMLTRLVKTYNQRYKTSLDPAKASSAPLVAVAPPSPAPPTATPTPTPTPPPTTVTPPAAVTPPAQVPPPVTAATPTPPTPTPTPPTTTPAPATRPSPPPPPPPPHPPRHHLRPPRP